VTSVLRAEWTKLCTVRSARWTQLAILGLTVGLTVLLTSASENIGDSGDNLWVGVAAGNVTVSGNTQY